MFLTRAVNEKYTGWTVFKNIQGEIITKGRGGGNRHGKGVGGERCHFVQSKSHGSEKNLKPPKGEQPE